MDLSQLNLLGWKQVLEESEADDTTKRDIYCKMGDLTFLARDVKDFKTEDEKDGKTKSNLHCQISVPGGETFGGKRVRLDFSYNAFKQLIHGQCGIPWQYMMKCPSALAKENFRHWQSAFADRDLLIRTRVNAGEKGDSTYARGILAATYGRLDNTQLIKLTDGIAKEANMGIWRYDMPDDSFHLKAVLADNVNMGTSGNPDPVHFGFHIANSETGQRALTVDIMTFRLLCTNGMITLIDGNRMVSQQHRGDIDINKLETKIRTKMHEVILKQDDFFGAMQSTKDSKPLDVYEEVRMVWAKWNLRKDVRNLVFQLLTETYTGGSRWDIVNAMTQAAQSLGDSPNDRVKIEEGAGMYMMLDTPLMQTALQRLQPDDDDEL